MTGSGLDRLVPHAMMQANESLYIGDFDLEPLQMTSQIQLPDMEALRLRSQRMSSPPTQLHHLMPAAHNGLTGSGHDVVHDPLRVLPTSQTNSGSLGPSHHTLTTMKYPGTPPDTPPCSSSPSPPYQSLSNVTTSGATTTIGLTDVTELVCWRGYNQDQALDLRGQCDLGGRGDKLTESAWLSMEYVDTEDPNLRHCTVIPALPPSTPTSSGSKVDGAGNIIDDIQVGEVTTHLTQRVELIIPFLAGHPQREGAQQEAARLPAGGRGQTQAEEENSEEQRLRSELSVQEAGAEAGPGDQQ